MQIGFMHYLKFDMKRTLLLCDKQVVAEWLRLQEHERGSSLLLEGHVFDERELIAAPLFCLSDVLQER